MNFEVTFKRGGLGGLDVTSYNDELMEALEEHADAAVRDRPTKCDYMRFRDAQKQMIKAIENMTGSNDPFTVTIRVEGMKRVYPPGPRLYTAGSDSGQVEDKTEEKSKL